MAGVTMTRDGRFMNTAYRDTVSCLRTGGAADLALALQASRRDTLALFATYEAALAGNRMVIPYSVQTNPPLWELGHIGWFQDWWLSRNPHWTRGTAADPDAPRMPARRPGADALFDSSRVPHASRWTLPLPDAPALRQDLADGLGDSLQLLQVAAPDHHGLYFHRLCLAHEDMHHEAAVYMAQALGIGIDDPRWQPQPLSEPGPPIDCTGAAWTLGSDPAQGFAFDNELGAHAVQLPPCRIDAQVLRWNEFLPFVEAGGYADARWWHGDALAWRDAHAQIAPRYLQRAGRDWMQWRHGAWQPLDPSLPACHLTAFEAEAYCAWAGRRLPSEAEWERACLSEPERFGWGQVWEWTASCFEPYPGFTPHPYRDYSAPWFGSRRVLRGASVATQPRLHHPRYRNFFTPERNDILAGFRTCDLPAT
jgi:ergothioneine biosynthesis protein EgtB